MEDMVLLQWGEPFIRLEQRLYFWLVNYVELVEKSMEEGTDTVYLSE